MSRLRSRYGQARRLAIAVSATLLAACSEGPTRPGDDTRSRTTFRVELGALPDTAGVGDTLAAVARVVDATGAPVADSVARLSSSNPAVIVLLPDGRLHALAVGRSLVRAHLGSAGDSAWVIVERLPRALRIVMASDTIFVGERVGPRTTLVLDGRGVPMDTARYPRFTVSDPSVLAPPHFDGVTAAIDEGSAELIATVDGLTGRQTLHGRFSSPIATPLPDGAAATEAGITWHHGCVRTALGNAYCWGRPLNGQLGNGLARQSVPPTRVTSPVPLVDLQVTLSAVCARGPTPDVYCWGFEPLLVGPAGAQAGTITVTPQRIPLPDSTGPIAELVPAYWSDRCARSAASSLFCWGPNANAAIGPRVASDSTSYRVRRLQAVPPFVRAAIAERHGCGVTAAGALWCWGTPFSGQQPDATRPASETPEQVATPHPVADVAAAFRSVCTIDDAGSIDCWGRNREGAAGDPLAGDVHVGRTRVTAPGRFVRIRAAGAGVCALNDAGELWCWGMLRHRTSPTPFRLAREQAFSSFAMGSDGEYAIVCGVTTSARVVCNQRWPQ